MSNAKRKAYDDDELVMAIASGAKSHRQIARDFGLSPTMIYFIVKGHKRPDLRARIDAATGEFRDRARRLLSHVSAPAVARLGKLIGDEPDVKPEVQLKAAVEILKFSLGTPHTAAGPLAEQFAAAELACCGGDESIVERVIAMAEDGRPGILAGPLAGPPKRKLVPNARRAQPAEDGAGGGGDGAGEAG